MGRMISREDLDAAVSKGILTPAQAEALWRDLDQKSGAPLKAFDIPHLMWYLGAFIVFFAVSWFLWGWWEKFNGLSLALVAALFAVGLGIPGIFLWNKPALKQAGGYLITLAVFMVAPAAYGLQSHFSWWPFGIENQFTVVAWALAGASLLLLSVIRFPLISALFYLSTWFLLQELIFKEGNREIVSSEAFSMIYGGLLILFGYYLDLKGKARFAFWGYFAGILSFWLGYTLMHFDSEWHYFAYCLVNLLLMGLSVFLDRILFFVFGIMGLFIYLEHLAYKVFSQTILFPLVIGLIGLLFIYLGVLYHQHQALLKRFAVGAVPERWRKFLPFAG